MKEGDRKTLLKHHLRKRTEQRENENVTEKTTNSKEKHKTINKGRIRTLVKDCLKWKVKIARKIER